MAKKTYAFCWSSLQQDATETIYNCYIAAFRAIKSVKAETWSIEDTQKMLSTSPEEIWKDKSLWGKNAEMARMAFYYKFDSQPRMALQSEARNMLKRLEEESAEFSIFSMKTKQLLLREISYSRSACLARGIYGTLPSIVMTKEELLKKISINIRSKKTIVIVAHKGYKEAAEALGYEFLEASEDVFKNICPDED